MMTNCPSERFFLLALPLTIYENVHTFTPGQTSNIMSLFKSNRSKTSLFSFLFLYQLSWGSFHMFISHLYFSFCELHYFICFIHFLTRYSHEFSFFFFFNFILDQFPHYTQTYVLICWVSVEFPGLESCAKDCPRATNGCEVSLGTMKIFSF